jgi:hypothetical protein
MAATALEELMVGRWLERFQGWGRVRGSFPADWQQAAASNQYFAYLTAAELTGLVEEVNEILSRYRERTLDESLRPAGALPVETMLFSYPVAAGPLGPDGAKRTTR